MGLSKLPFGLTHKFSENSENKKGRLFGGRRRSWLKPTSSSIEKSAGSLGSITSTQSISGKEEKAPEAKVSPHKGRYTSQSTNSQGSNNIRLADDQNELPLHNRHGFLGANPQVVSTRSAVAPIRRTHLLCYTAHGVMKKASKIRHPLPCMACKGERSPRLWRCTFCYLRICDRCKDALRSFDNNSLQRLLESRGIDPECT